MKASKEIKIGLTVIVAVAFLIFGINYLKGVNLFNNNREYKAKYTEVDGLVTASPVIFRGMKIGQVTEIEIQEGGKSIMVTFVIDNDDIKIPIDSRATIFSADLLGTRAINLDFGKSEKIAEPGALLKGGNQQSLGDRVDQEIAPIKKKAEELLGSIDTLVTIVKKVIGDNKSGLDASIQSVQRTLRSIERTAENLDGFVAEERGKLSVTFSKVQSFATNMANNNDKITSLINNLEKVSSGVAESDIGGTLKKLNTTLGEINAILAHVKEGNGTLGKLINSDSLHNALIATNQKVQDLLDNFMQHPNRYLHISVFGSKEKGLKLTAAEEKKLKQLLNN